MKKFQFKAIFAVAIALGILNLGAQQTNNDSSVPDFSAFKIITQRNIFDPNRTGRIVSTNYTPRPHRTTEYVALVGTMSYPKGRFAFFDGSSSQYKKVLESGATIAGYTIKDVSSAGVTLAQNGKEFQMKVGTQLRSEGDNKWQLSAHTEETTNTESDTGADASTATTTSPSTPPASSSPEMNEVLKRLMQNRDQELK